jgi:AraC-like DNA-binding protein
VDDSNKLSSRDFSRWQEEMSSSFVRLEVEKASTNFEGEMLTRKFDRFSVVELKSSAQVIHRLGELITPEDDGFAILSLQISGTGSLLQDGRHAVTRPGEMTLLNTSRPYTRVYDNDFRSLVLRLPSDSLNLPPRLLDEFTAVTFNGQDGTSAALSHYLTALADNLESLSTFAGSRLAQHAIDLVSTMLLDVGGLDSAALEQGSALSHFVAARDFIEANYANAALDPETVAKACFVSVRTLHNAFAAQGLTVASYVRDLRFDRVRRDLSNPVLINETIAEVARGCGLSDPAGFARQFRKRFGMSASEYRAEILGR